MVNLEYGDTCGLVSYRSFFEITDSSVKEGKKTSSSFADAFAVAMFDQHLVAPFTHEHYSQLIDDLLPYIIMISRDRI